MLRILAAALLLFGFLGHEIIAADGDWRPAESPLLTSWGAQVTPDNVHPEYPRPQLRRPAWQSLNGLWQFAVTDTAAAQPDQYEGSLLVPFPIESALSGVKRTIKPDQVLWLSRTFRVADLPGHEPGRRILLHFGAVDWESTVWINGQQVGRHRGGYDPFTFDITSAAQPDKDNTLVVRVLDPTDSGYQPRGKQVLKPEGIWYTAVTGIWRTVWLESVPDVSFERLVTTSDIEAGAVTFRAHLREARPATELRVEVLDGQQPIARGAGPADQPLRIVIDEPKLWSPDTPFLYEVRAQLVGRGAGEEVLDEVESYFGMRSITVGRDKEGFQRLLLNNKPLFQFGPLDQGWWPDGLYTAPSDEALRFDLEVTKRLGFNMVRKHVKVEPDRWYYHCDRLGLLVWQDMPNGDRHIGPREPDIERTEESAKNYYHEWNAIITALESHPCIVAWVPFNEGWGQFDTDEVLRWTRKRDPTRLVDGPSGWTDRGSGDLHDMHLYPGPGMPRVEEDRAVVLGEFGGLGLPVQGHLWRQRDNWGYRTYRRTEDLQASYESLIRRLRPLVGRGLAAAVYTQTTDVEGEVNGLLTYDRKVLKLDENVIAALHGRLYEEQLPTLARVLVPTSEETAQLWRYTTDQPSDDWYRVDFDDGNWREAPGGFGEPTTPGTVVRTEWKTSDVWMRREVVLEEPAEGRLHLRVHHDEDAEVYLNGVRVAILSGFVTQYEDVELSSEAAAALRQGRNVLAVHCHQTGGGQYIDVGLLDVLPQGAPPSRTE